MRVAFAGTPEFAAVALRSVLDAGFEVVLVLTQPDRPAGRGLKLQASPVKQLAQQRGLSLAQPRGLRLDGKHAVDAEAAREAVAASHCDVMVVAAYGLILPPWLLALPRLGCLNIHASLLPRWRGAAPIHRAIEAGDTHSGVTIMQMDAGLDTGDMLRVEAVALAPDESTATLHDKLAALGGRLIVEALHAAVRGTLTPQPQPMLGVTYALKVDKAQGCIDWQQDATQIERRIRAFDPQPGCHFEFEGEPLKVWRARPAAGFGGVAGEMRIDGRRWFVACDHGQALELLEVQRPGGRRQGVDGFLASRASR